MQFAAAAPGSSLAKASSHTRYPPCHSAQPAMSDAVAGPSSSTINSNAGKAKVPNLPQNLRFQRRQSERAFYEGAYREGTPTMEYPSGTSPWASSPEASRTSIGGDIPREDLPAPAVQVPGIEGEQAVHANGAYQQPHEGGWTPEQAQGQWQQQHAQNPDQQQQRGPGEENRRPASARYHNVPQQQQQPQQRQHMPQYKLQAKITGLERPAKKDPILKFDVHVCCGTVATLHGHSTNSQPDQPPQIQDYPIPRHPPYTL